MTGIDSCLQRIMEIPGAHGALLADSTNSTAIAHAGRGEADGRTTTDAIRALLGCPALVAGGRDVEIIIRDARGFHLVSTVDGPPAGPLLLHAKFDDRANMALARFRLRDIVAELTDLVEPARVEPPDVRPGGALPRRRRKKDPGAAVPPIPIDLSILVRMRKALEQMA
ncbi:MAG: hypothetical protein HOQ24_01045 [Mycobacteriaceae bacterium]|nr:hypothetical protein [Mycobacteriaceae bacterium]